MRMQHLLIVTLWLVQLAAGFRQGSATEPAPPANKAGKKPGEKAPLKPAEHLEHIQKRFKKQLERLQKAFRSAETAAQRQQIQQEYAALQRSETAGALQLAEKSPDLSAAAFEWVVRAMVDDTARQQAKRRWLTAYANDSRLASVLAVMGMADERPFLRQLVKKSSNPNVLGSACFHLAMSLRRQDKLTDKEQAEAISLLERVVAKHSKQMLFLPGGRPAGKLGDLAGPPLYEFKYLSVGKVAPEIVGEDIDGDALKLSDYRGRVVVLSFWGDW